jgi:hypothetical protein
MPLELGLFIAAKYYGRGDHDRKVCLVFERKKHSYEALISDIKGQDIVAHGNEPRVIVTTVRNWLASNSKGPNLPGGHAVWSDYRAFQRWLPGKCRRVRLKERDLTFGDYVNLIYGWIESRE